MRVGRKGAKFEFKTKICVSDSRKEQKCMENDINNIFKCLADNLNPEFERNMVSCFWKNAIWRFLPYKAESDLNAKSKATDYQNAICDSP